MIKQAYFRGLTKVAGEYSLVRPRTWSARKNPLSGIINPAVDKVYGMTPAGKAQKKILKGSRLTPAQEKAARDASSWGNALKYGPPAGYGAIGMATGQGMWRAGQVARNLLKPR